MRDQFDNYEKRIREKLDREAEEIERRIKEDPQAAEARADEELDRKVYAGVEAYENAAAKKNGSGAEELACAEELDDAVLAGLPEKDREALRLGRELQRRLREEEGREEAGETARKRKCAGGWKRFAAAVVVLVLVAGAGLHSVGGPNRIVEIMKLAISGREVSQGNSSSKDVKLSIEEKEMEAYQQIKDELGIDPVRLLELPDGTKFKSCEVDSEIRLVQLMYLFGDRNLSYLITDSYTEELWSIEIEDEVLEEYPYAKGRLNAEITEYKLPESKEKKYVAKFEYNGIYYQLTGTMEWENFEAILKNLYFPV